MKKYYFILGIIFFSVLGGCSNKKIEITDEPMISWGSRTFFIQASINGSEPIYTTSILSRDIHTIRLIANYTVELFKDYKFIRGAKLSTVTKKGGPLNLILELWEGYSGDSKIPKPFYILGWESSGITSFEAYDLNLPGINSIVLYDTRYNDIIKSAMLNDTNIKNEIDSLYSILQSKK